MNGMAKGVEHSGRILITGFGAVSQALLPMLLEHVEVPPENVTVIDFAQRKAHLAEWIGRGLKFVRERVTPANLSRLGSSYVSAGGRIVDLTWSMDVFASLEWAHLHAVLYVNASLESWDPTAEMQAMSTMEKALYTRYSHLLEVVPTHRDGATAVVDHGLNPGLISHFVKRGLLDIASAVIRESDTRRSERLELERLMSAERFAELARALGVKVIHCSEADTQRSGTSKSSDEFVNTWSVEGMWE